MSEDAQPDWRANLAEYYIAQGIDYPARQLHQYSIAHYACAIVNQEGFQEIRGLYEKHSSPLLQQRQGQDGAEKWEAVAEFGNVYCVDISDCVLFREHYDALQQGFLELSHLVESIFEGGKDAELDWLDREGGERVGDFEMEVHINDQSLDEWLSKISGCRLPDNIAFEIYERLTNGETIEGAGGTEDMTIYPRKS